ncbi:MULTISPECIES: 50S ribosomal protein L29 [Acidiphilium]|jgi:LSU ribosomal protein L29P|uniref:Large ribosomal subunit protein uL29 n=2 Tax=Acidiphilium TaxID=522 RepID=A0A8G2CIB1_ACIRU|nr:MULTISPECIES: 50S ribosomal protein L29 [Acidiphilium]MBW4034692.1 50S ribosomal protein L29 [Pseudomonadota bacterium]GBQ24539.1 50S ribosomal protein L29 [Acidiphilium acidophilum DSM 700]MDD2860261.1 50S ribosomal protein L29 [Acidiphilium sp.]MDX5931996.1 50S ribosomal protein L29 [Acidiphilium acidophilum]OYW03874.1 MAG: 50S ribosomal protein L29 [Acidiphilium sp. 37-64-53]
MTKAADIRVKTPDETNDFLLDLKREQLNLRFQRATGQQENTSQMRKTRRDVARVKTIMAERLRASAKV